MPENLSLGKKGKYGEFDFSKIRSGIKKEELLKDVDPKLKSVFEQILNEVDTNPNDNMLSRNELEAFFKKIQELAAKKDDDNLSAKEAKGYTLANGKKIAEKAKMPYLISLINFLLFQKM